MPDLKRLAICYLIAFSAIACSGDDPAVESGQAGGTIAASTTAVSSTAASTTIPSDQDRDPITATATATATTATATTTKSEKRTDDDAEHEVQLQEDEADEAHGSGDPAASEIGESGNDGQDDDATSRTSGDQNSGDRSSAGGNVFTDGNPEQHSCLRDALGDAVFEAIASGERTPTESDNRAMNPCVGGPDSEGHPDTLDAAAQPTQDPPDGNTALQQADLSGTGGSGGSSSDPPETAFTGDNGGPTGGGPFNSSSPETKACLREALGNAVFEAIASGASTPSSDDNSTMGHCFAATDAPSSGGATPTSPLPGLPVDQWTMVQASPVTRCTSSTAAHSAVGDFFWQHRPVLSGEVSNFSISPVLPSTLYLGGETNSHSVYKSTDYGRTWSRVNSSDHAKDVAIHPTDPEIVFKANSMGLMRSSIGQSDEYLEFVLQGEFVGPSATSFSSVAISASDPDVVYTAQKGANASGGAVLLDGGVVYRSVNRGLSFTEVATGTPIVNVLAVDPTASDRLLLGSTDGVHESTDGGKSFNSVVGSTNLGKVLDLNSNDGITWYAATEGGIARSNDTGLSWHLTSSGLPSSDVQQVEAVRDHPGVVWATTRAGVVRSTDGGVSFVDVSGVGSPGGLPAVNLQALGVWPDAPNRAIVSTNSLMFSVRAGEDVQVQGQLFNQGIFLTTDGGLTWERVGMEVAEKSIIEIETNPLRPTEVWTGQQASRGLFRSRDAGQSWSQSNTLLTHYPMKLAFVPGAPDRLILTSSHSGEEIGITTDSGQSWMTRSEKTFFDAVDIGRSLYVESSSYSSKLHLHGLAVSPENPNLVLTGSVHEPDGFTPVRLSGAHIYRSEDGGSTWTESMLGFNFEAKTAIHHIVFDPSSPTRVYLGTTAHESLYGNGLWRSLDTGRSWERSNSGMPDDESVNGIAVHPTDSRLLVAATNSGMYASTDSGDSWTLTFDSPASDTEADFSNPGVIYAATNDGALQSLDFGLTWQNITDGRLSEDYKGIDNAQLANPPLMATAVGVSCDGAIVYIAIEGIGVLASVAPGYGDIPEDPHQVSEISQRQYANHYDADRRIQR
ncbi:MAG: WD40/YVTN/BNR-like repeat-containing protein [Acidimicrobiales bacterium]